MKPVHLRVGGRVGQLLCGAPLVIKQGDLLEGAMEMVTPSSKFYARTTCETCRAWFRKGRGRVTRRSSRQVA